MATTRDWLGGQHDFFAAGSWTPTGQPVAGDTMVIGLGSAAAPNVATASNAVLSGFQTVLDGGPGAAGTDPAGNPTLVLANAAIAAGTSIDARSEATPFVSVTPTAENMVVNALGVNYGSIGESTMFNSLNIALGNYTALYNWSGGTISGGDYDGLNIEGTGGPAVFVNNGTVSGHGTAIDIGTQVWGTGAFDLTAGSGFNSSSPNPSTIEFHQAVTAGQTVSLSDSTLILDSPMSFLGTIADPAVSAPGPFAGNSSVLLVGETATGLSFQNNVLTVTNGSTVLAQLGFAAGLAATDFTFNAIPAGSSLPAGTDIHIQLPSSAQTAAIGVAQTHA